jgi:hypothetical protein
MHVRGKRLFGTDLGIAAGMAKVPTCAPGSKNKSPAPELLSVGGCLESVGRHRGLGFQVIYKNANKVNGITCFPGSVRADEV